MQANARKQAAMATLQNRLLLIQGIDDIRDALYDEMTTDWILNAEPNQPGVDTPLQMKELVEAIFQDEGVQIDNQQATELLNAWRDFVPQYYAVNGGRRKKTRKTKKSRKHKRRASRKH